MSGLLDSLSTASAALDAQRMGLDVAGQNLANVNTVGYSRRSLQLAEVPSTGTNNVGRGVQVLGVAALRDPFVNARINRETQGAQYDGATTDVLSVVESGIGTPGTSLDASLSSFFDAFQTLATDPTSAAARTTVLAQGQSLASTFQSISEKLTSAQSNADSEVRSDIDQVNQLATQVAKLNGQIQVANGADVEALRDQRAVALQSLAGLVGASTQQRADGGIDVTVGQGHALVIGDQAYGLSAGSAGISGFATVQSQGTDITSEIQTGSIGGLIAARDTAIPGYQSKLDQLAFDVAGQVNTLHQAGFDGNGNAGGAFFTPLGSASGAAAAFSVRSAVASDPSLVAASGSGALGDNQIAQSIAALRNAKITNGGTASPTDAWAQLVYQVGADTAGAQASQTTHQSVIDQLSQLRDNVSGVSIDEEAANLLKFQRAYEANARYFTTVNTALDALMAMVVL